MSPEPKKNTIKVIFWSVVAIAFGIFLSGLVIKAFSYDVFASQNEEPRERSSNILAFVDKIKDFTKLAGSKAENVLAKVNFDKIVYPPEASYHLKDENLLPHVGASSYVIGDADTGKIIIQKDSDSVYPIASVTKLMTALVSLEEIDQSDIAKVSNKALGTLSTRGELRVGEKIKINELLFPLLLVSSNDASEVLAEHKGRERFMSLMNQKAEEVGMLKTNFEDPSGLSANNYSTAEDLFRLSSYLFTKHKTVFNITTLDKYSFGGRTWFNANNQFSKRDDYLGGKTGYTDKAKRTGVSVFSVPFEGFENRNIVIILLKTDNRNEDINEILEYLDKNVYFAYDEKIESAKTAEITLGFAGDIMLDRGVKTSVIKNFGGDYSKVFALAEFLTDPDIMFANLEGPISDKGRNVGSIYSFRFDPVVVKTIKDAGIDIVSFANNHVGDYSNEAFLDTLGRLKEGNVLFTGAGETYDEAKKPTIIERGQIRIGYLAFSDVGPEWIKATTTTPGILLANDPNLGTIITEAKKLVDFLVVSVHWGDEYKEHNSRQATLAKKIIDAGANVIVGHHPHVIQDIEEYKDGLIIYSLGNFVFDQYFSPETMEGLYVEMKIGKSGIKDYKETVFKINEKYQPVLKKVKEKIEPIGLKRGSCPAGNSEDNFLLFNSNNENSINRYVPENLVEIHGVIPTKEKRTVCLTLETANNLQKMYQDGLEAGVDIVVSSGFRSYDAQNYLRDESGAIDDNGNENIAKPGHSEHQLGTTVDLTTKNIDEASASNRFEDTPEYEWLTKHAHEYGFVMSYPEGKNTGYIFEPWHFRYLGPDIAKEIKSKNLTIQEYLKGL